MKTSIQKLNMPLCPFEWDESLEATADASYPANFRATSRLIAFSLGQESRSRVQAIS